MIQERWGTFCGKEIEASSFKKMTKDIQTCATGPRVSGSEPLLSLRGKGDG